MYSLDAIRLQAVRSTETGYPSGSWRQLLKPGKHGGCPTALYQDWPAKKLQQRYRYLPCVCEGSLTIVIMSDEQSNNVDATIRTIKRAGPQLLTQLDEHQVL